MKSVIRGPYFNDLMQQPAAVEATLVALRASPIASSLPAIQDFKRVVLTGMGSSLAALHPLAIRLVEHGATAIVLDSSELIHSMRELLATKDTLVIAVSQSGRSAELVRLVESSKSERAYSLIAVTNTPDSPLALGADSAVLTYAGTESTVSCKTYVAALAALVFLGDALCGHTSMMKMPTLATAPGAMSAYLDRWEHHIAELAPLLDGVRDVFFAGRGTSLAAAQTAGLIVKESTRYHAEGMTSAALRHGPMEMAADHVFALVYEGDAKVAPLNRALVDDLRRAGARAHLAGTAPAAEHEVFRLAADAAPELRSILEMLPAQMISLALAAQSGIEAGRFLHATKVTATE